MTLEHDPQEHGLQPREIKAKYQYSVGELFPELKESQKRNEAVVVLEVGSGGVPGILNSASRNKEIDKRYWVTLDEGRGQAERAKLYESSLGDKFKALEGDGRKVPFGEGEFNEVVYNNVMSDIYENEAELMITEAIRVLKENGRILIHEFYDEDSGRGTFLDFGGNGYNFINFLKTKFPDFEVSVKSSLDDDFDAPNYTNMNFGGIESAHQIILKPKQISNETK